MKKHKIDPNLPSLKEIKEQLEQERLEFLRTRVDMNEVRKAKEEFERRTKDEKEKRKFV